jgi:uncharacterized spore protein YtfJ
MKRVIGFLETLSKGLERLTAGNAVIAKPISIGNRHVLPLCELSLVWGAGGGEGEGEADESGKGHGQGTGGGGGGAAKANPVAIIVVEDGKVRLESLDA